MSSCIELLDNFWHLQFSLGQTSNDKHFSCIFKICLSFSFLFTVHFFFIDVLVIYPLDVFFFFFFFYSHQTLLKVYVTMHIVKKPEYKSDIVSRSSTFGSLQSQKKYFYYFVINFECFVSF